MNKMALQRDTKRDSSVMSAKMSDLEKLEEIEFFLHKIILQTQKLL